MTSRWILLPMASQPKWLPLPKLQPRILTRTTSHGCLPAFASHGFLTELAATSEISNANFDQSWLPMASCWILINYRGFPTEVAATSKISGANFDQNSFPWLPVGFCFPWLPDGGVSHFHNFKREF